MPVTIIKRSKATIAVEPVAATLPESFHIANLADVLERLPTTDLPERAHRDVRWAINTFCTGLGVAPIDVPADARSIRDRLDSLSPAMLGFRSVAAFSTPSTCGSWRIALSLIRCRVCYGYGLGSGNSSR